MRKNLGSTGAKSIVKPVKIDELTRFLKKACRCGIGCEKNYVCICDGSPTQYWYPTKI